jgi:hypothetical protein
MVDWMDILDTTIAYRKGTGLEYRDVIGLRNEVAERGSGGAAVRPPVE